MLCVKKLSIFNLNLFEKCVPEKLDRYDHKGLALGNIVPESMILMQSKKRWDERRKAILKTIGINFASKYISMMLDIVDDWIINLSINEDLNLTFELNKITFRIITKILFGRDLDKMDKCVYISPNDGSLLMLSFEECYLKYSKDETESYFSPIGKIFPTLADLKFIEPFKTNAKNKTSIDNALRKFLSKSEDDQSVYRQILKNYDFSQEEVFADVLLLLLAGFDTTSHGLGSALYFLKKYPEVMKKLNQALNEHDIPNIKSTEESSELKDKFENCDYLTYVSREALRIDPPTFSGFLYFAKQNVEICGVEFNKGSFLCPNMMFAHHNPNEWYNPTEFIPERFDPESDYFFKPNSREVRDPMSYIPFSLGLRNCAGQTLAKLESRVILSRILTSVEYEIDQSLLDNETSKFNLLSQLTVNGKITKRYHQK